jgi:hypothetical protein
MANPKWSGVKLNRSLFNILVLDAVADFGAHNCHYNTKVETR